MNIIIAGLGNIGAGLGARLLHEGHNITLIDKNPKKLEDTMSSKDVQVIAGNCASMDTLRNAGITSADVLIAATESDERNLLCCITAHNLNEEIKTIARIRTPEYAETTGMFFDKYGLSMTIDPQQYAAKDIEAVLHYPGLLHRERFSRGMTDVISLDLPADHPLCGHPLKDMPSLTQIRALVCAVVRNEKAQTPNGDFVLEAGDRIYITAAENDLAALLRSFGTRKITGKKIMIVGGGATAVQLIERLRSHHYEVTILEHNRTVCDQLAERFDGVDVIYSEGTNLSQMDTYDLNKQDALLCLTGDDETNTILGVYGSLQKVPSIIIKLNDMNYGAIFDKTSHGTIINPKRLCGDAIVRYLRSIENQNNAAVSIRSIAGDTQIAEFIIGPGAKHCGESLKNIRFKNNVILASINRYGKNILPGADTMFLNGDRVLAVFSRDDIRGFNDLFR